MDLSLHRVLSALELDRDVHIHHLVESTGMSADAIRRVLGELESQGLARVTREKVIHWILSPTGLAALEKNSLPEQRLGTILDPKPLSLDDLRNTFDGTTQEFTAAFGLAKRSQWIEVKGDGEQTMVALTHLGKKSIANSPVWMMLQALARDEFPPRDSPIVAELQARGLILPKTTTNELARLTPDGKKALAQKRISSSKQIGPLTPSILMSGDWKKGSFKPYDVKAGVDEKQVGRIHPLRSVIYDVQKIMVELGFQEQESPLVESAFWNMDVMFIPQDHPAREIQDTFYLPSGRAVLPDAQLVKRVKAMHEHGGKTGSTGFGYEWDPRIAMQLLLRTHGSATTFRTLATNLPIPSKTFSIGRVFRNEAIDPTHLAEFYQVDGLVMGENLTLRHLMGVIKEFYAKLGLTRIKFRPTYNPYTEPSMEALAFHPRLKIWVELINSGIFRPETLAPLGIHVPVISWGFGLERAALFIHEKATLKEILGPEVDLDYIRHYPITRHTIPGGKMDG